MSFIDDAKAAISLEGYLRDVLGDPITSGASLRWKRCINPECSGETERGKLYIRSDGRHFSCWDCGAKGDVIEAARLNLGLSSNQTVLTAKRLLNHAATTAPRAATVRPPTDYTLTRSLLKRIAEASESLWNPDVVRYLTDVRKLPLALVKQAWMQGELRMLPSNPVATVQLLQECCGRDALLQSGLWREGALAPAIAYRPLMFCMPGLASAEFRLLREAVPGEAKSIRYASAEKPWVLRGEKDHFAITEGYIDALSMRALGYEGTVVGLPGCNSWVGRERWFDAMAGKKVYVCFDNDQREDGRNPGQSWADKLMKNLARAAQPILKAPPAGQDVNDLLKSKKAP